MLNDVSTLIFDLDGTISDPSAGIIRSINHALRSHGYPEESDSAISRHIGPPLDEIFHAFQPHVADAEMTTLVAAYRERYSRRGYAENTLYPGMDSFIKNCRAAGLRQGVCTSKRADYARKIVDLFDLSECLSFVDGGDIGIHKRQQLAGLLETGRIDQDAVMVGDRAVDIEAGRANGLRTAGVLWGFGDRDELEAAAPDWLLGRVAELTAWIDQFRNEGQLQPQ